MEINLIYITVGSLDEAKKIGKTLVSTRLAACANIIDNINSIYWWDGEIQDEREVIVVAKTKRSRVHDLIEKVKSIHSYECPCIVSLPIIEGNGAFLDWIVRETM
jgi:periplasmic divalent cation tolerance protein